MIVMCARAKSLQSCPTLWTPWIGVGCHALLQGILLTQGSIEPAYLKFPALADRFFTTSYLGSPSNSDRGINITTMAIMLQCSNISN